MKDFHPGWREATPGDRRYRRSRRFACWIAGSVLFGFEVSAAAPPDSDAAAAVRRADAAWNAAASNAGVDAWAEFYAADAAVSLPHAPLATGIGPRRDAVSRLMALPRFSIAWRPITLEVARSGDVVLVVDSYDLRSGDAQGTPLLEQGRRLEIWRLQAGGLWKCAVDVWNLDGAAAPPPEPGPPAAASPPGAATPEGSGQPAASEAKYGGMPANYAITIRAYFQQRLKHPESVQYGEISRPVQGYTTTISGTVLMREKRVYGWSVTAAVNARNSRDDYVGYKTYSFLFRGETLIDVRGPLPGDEMN